MISSLIGISGMLTAFVLGLGAVVWVGVGFAGSSVIALAVTAVIGAAYLLGASEIARFRARTRSLAAAIAAVPQPLPALSDWLFRVDPALRAAVRLRIEGERVALPGLVLTPYLLGLLVMLGMLGTFLGVVVTFKGAVLALEGSADLQVIRQALAGPIKGLAFSFGTSVAGVASSAMLGLMSVISRRERLSVVQQLDIQIAGVFRPFSLVHQRQETYRALQSQAQVLPDVARQLHVLIEQIEHRSLRLDEQLLGRQEQFHREVSVAYTVLASSVEQSLRDSLAAGARVAGESVAPVVQSAMQVLAEESRHAHERLVAGVGGALEASVESVEQRAAALLLGVQQTLSQARVEQALADQQARDAWVQSLESTAVTLAGQWERAASAPDARQQALCQTLESTAAAIAERSGDQAARIQGDVARLLEQSEAVLRSHRESEARWVERQGARMDQLAALWRAELGALRGEEAERGQAAVARLGELQAALSVQLAALGSALENPLARLLQTAAEVPRAAAQVIAQLREEMSHLTERDNLALQERATLIEGLGALLQVVHLATGEQRAAIETLVTSASGTLEQVGRQFADTLGIQTTRTEAAAAQVAGSAIDLASLGEAFAHGAALFSASNEKLAESLDRVEGAIGQSMTRSDEQLAYYVAQAREVIDLSIGAQQGIVQDLRRLHGKPAASDEGPAG